MSETGDQRDKRLATLRARLALLGFQLSELASGGWLVHRFDGSASCADLREVAAVLQRLEEAV